MPRLDGRLAALLRLRIRKSHERDTVCHGCRARGPHLDIVDGIAQGGTITGATFG